MEFHHYANRNWRSISGLSHDNVTSIYSDSNGFIWVGTIEGVTRIDGASTKVFNTRTHSGLVNNRIVGISGTKDGRIYLATVTGVSLVTGPDRIEKIIEENGIKGISTTDDGTLFLIKDKEVVVVKDSNIKRLTVLSGLPDGELTVVSGFKNTIYIANELGGIFKYSNGKFSEDICPLNSEKVTSITAADENRVLFGTTAGEIFTVKEEVCEKLYSVSEISTESFPIVAISSMNGTTVAAGDENLIIIKDGKNSLIKNCCNMPGTISAVLIDRDDFIWLGGDRGVALYYEGTFRTLGKEDGLFSEMVYGMVEDNNENVWVGTRGGGLFHYSDGKFRNISDKYGIKGRFIGGMLVDSSGELWIGTTMEIVNFAPKFPLKIKKAGKVPLASVIFEDSSQRIWAGTSKGKIYLYTKNKFVLVKDIGGLQENFITAITEDSKGTLYFASSSGILVLENETFRTITTADGLPDNAVLSLFADESGVIFAGTMRKGLAVVKKDGKTVNIDSRIGLCSDTIFSINKDGYGRIWFTSTQGIFSIPFDKVLESVNDPQKSVKCFSFDSQDGIKRAECTGGVQPPSMIRRDGSLWFPTVEGIAVSRNGQEKLSTPHISIDSVIADGKSLDAASSLNFKGTLSLLEIKMTASRMIHPERLKVRYKLSGFEDEWNDFSPTEKRTVTYQKIGSGDYVFVVEALSQNGEKIEKALKIHIEDDGFFSKIDMKWVLILIIFLSVIMLFFVNYNRRKKGEAADEKSEEDQDVDDSRSVLTNDESFKDDSPKYEKSRLDETIAESYATELKELMENRKPYKNPDLTLPDLAKKLNLSTNILSQVINSYCCQNFYNYVNSYRVEEVIKMMNDESMKEKSILDMAYEAGFKSKTTFNTIFKKQTGRTPSEFRKNISEDSEKE